MTRHILSKSLAAFALVLMASSVTQSFAQSTTTLTLVHSLSAGQSNGGQNPDPTGDGGGGNMAVHSSLFSE